MKRQVVGFDDAGFWVSSGYAPLRVPWSEVTGVYAKVYHVGAQTWRVFGIELEGHDPSQFEDWMNGVNPLELHSDALNLAAFQAKVYERFNISPDSQVWLACLEAGETHRVGVRISPG